MHQLIEASILLLILLVFSIFSYRKKLLDRDGILLANIVGIASYLFGGGIFAFCLMVLFFIIAEFCTKLARRRKIKHERRTMSNIAGNSGAAIISLLLGNIAGFFGAISAALADTLSSEIGLTSKKKPVLITTFEEVEAGTDGGVTKRGMYAALLGGSIVGVFHFLLHWNFIMLFGLIVAGIAGSVVDSLFGAVLERKKVIGNMEVNFLGSASGALIAVLFSLIAI